MKSKLPINDNGWVYDSRMAELINKNFRAPNQAVPVNPKNTESHQPLISWFPGSLYNNEKTNPYGDARLSERQPEPQIVSPTDSSQRIQAPPPMPGAEQLPWLEQPANVALDLTTQSYTAAPPPPALGTNMGQVGGSNRNQPDPRGA